MQREGCVVAGSGAEGFSWWDRRHRVWRRALYLFALAAAVVGVYMAALIAVVVAVLRSAGVGPWHRIDSAVDDLGWLGLAVGLVALLVASGVAIGSVGWRGFPRVTLR